MTSSQALGQGEPGDEAIAIDRHGREIRIAAWPAAERLEGSLLDELEDQFLTEDDPGRASELGRRLAETYRVRLPDDFSDDDIIATIEKVMLDSLPDRDAAYDIEDAIKRNSILAEVHGDLDEDGNPIADEDGHWVGSRPMTDEEVRTVMINRLADVVESTGGSVRWTYREEPVQAVELGEEREEAEVGRPVPLADLGARVRPGEGVVRDFLFDGQVVTIVGEEGEGKSTLAWQIACQLAAGQAIGGQFEVGMPVRPVLIVDVEQSEEDAVILRDDMTARGLQIDGVSWLDAQGRQFDNVEDAAWLTAQVRMLRPQVMILDTGTEAVSRPREDESVKPLFVKLYSFLKNEGVRTVILLAQPRKRAQGEPNSRRFDDLFGSRVWKGRSSAVLYLDRDSITVWKQRGGYIRRRWGTTVGRYVRSDTEPAMILAPKTSAESEGDREAAILGAIREDPGEWSKTSLLEKKLGVSGRQWGDWAKTVERLVRDARVEARGTHKKLYPMEG